jgi:uncharacterized protein (DUF1800 family)
MLAPLEPKQWDMTKAAHLLNRAGFGGSPQEIQAFYKLGLDGSVKQLLDAPDDAAQFPKPAWAAPRNLLEMRQQARDLPPEERKMRIQQAQKEMRENLVDLIGWWVGRMRETPNPLREKLTLFWHGHFATSAQKVKDAYLMWQQNEMLRAHALGNFGDMTKAIARDPAMMIYLDTRESRKAHPNENFARELMELFTLGIGNYTEEDIQQAARAFTGYKINPVNETFRWAPFQNDDGEKKFFGKTGPFSGDDIINMILEKPACAKFISKKIWEFFAFEDPKPALVDQVAASFRGHNYAIKPLMNEIFRSAEFYSPDAIRTQIKSPVQWIVQTARILETDLPKPFVVANSLRQLGQVPFAPPSVKGWDGGKAWITTSTLLLRYNLANFAVGNGPMNVERGRRVAGLNKNANRPGVQVENGSALDFAKIAPQELRSEPKRLVEYVCFRLFQDPLTPRETEKFVNYLEERKANGIDDETIRDLLHLMMSTPQFQLT